LPSPLPATHSQHVRSVPPNLEFFVDDLENDWTYVNKFDFIYARMLTGAIKDWPRLISQAYQ
jgi:hypothetical protein